MTGDTALAITFFGNPVARHCSPNQAPHLKTALVLAIRAILLTEHWPRA